MNRPRLVFVTYYRLVPTTQIGVFKRCMRLIQHLLADFEIHLINFGPLPDKDALFSELRPHLHVPNFSDENLGNELMRIFSELAPEAVVFGETPLRGSMRLAHRVASARGLWQVCIENYYGDFSNRFFPSEWPRIDRWLLLGLMASGRAEASGERVEIVPPLVGFPSGQEQTVRDRVVILGYDKQTLLMGTRLLRRLPADQKIDILVSPEWESFLDKQRGELARPGRRILVLPKDHEIYDSMSRARFVLGKAGFQQVVESISLGAPIVCQLCGGGVDEGLIDTYLKPYVRFIATEDDLERVMFDIAGWLLAPPDLPWAKLGLQVPEPRAHAARRLRELVAQRAKPMAGAAPEPASAPRNAWARG